MTDSENKSHLDEDYIDVEAEFESDIDDLSDDNDGDYDADNEDGIFAPGEAVKKKSNVKLTGMVIALALLSGGAFYFYNQMNTPASVEMPSTADITDIPQAPVDATADASGIPVIPTPTSDFDTDAPEVVMDQSGGGMAPTVPDVHDNDNPENAISVVGSKNDAPPSMMGDNYMPPITNVQAAPAPDVAPEIAPSQTPPVQDNKTVAVVPNVDDKVELAEESEIASQPDTAILQPVTADKKSSLPVPAAPKKTESAKAAAKKAPEKTVYFDAPKGRALSDIPPPSIDPMREPGESIIIVHKGSRASDMIVEKGDQSGYMESKLVNATRAANLGSYEAALGFYNELYKANPSDPRILMGRAVTLQKLGENDKAIQAYRDVLDVQSNNPEAITNLMGLIGKTQPAVALQNLLELREKYPRNAAVAGQLGVAYTQSGNSQDGLKYLDMAAKLQPENPLHPFNMAVVYEHLNDRANAIKFYEQALDTYSVNGSGTSTSFSREQIYDRLAALRGN